MFLLSARVMSRRVQTKKSAMDMRFPNFQDHEAFEVPLNVGSIPFSSPNLGKSWELSLNPEQPLGLSM